NKLLGEFTLTGIPPAPRGVPQIEVSFDIDANGILNVTAKDKATGKAQSMQITAPNKLNEAEVERMRKEAEQFAEQDKKRKEEIETINQADTLVYSTEKMLNEYKDKIDENTAKPVKDKISELKKLLAEEKKDVAKIKSLVGEIEQLAQKMGAAMYQQSQQAQQSQQGPQQDAGQGEVHDTEAKEKDKK
ncbi:MAG TPA: molecular chaperone DnaK, partial [Candidatus Woesearchaeota archaeon]|nr:molecular chaperone DnaK [Candidatus Woesearchaeota archaeon]